MPTCPFSAPAFAAVVLAVTRVVHQLRAECASEVQLWKSTPRTAPLCTAYLRSLRQGCGQEWVNVNSYEDILSWFQHHPYLKSSNPEPVTVGGVKGVELETDVAKDSPEDAVKSFRYSDGFVARIDRGARDRTIILDMKGEAVSIGVDFPEAQKVVDTVKWGGS